MKLLGKKYLEQYAVFENDFVSVEIPFIHISFFEELMRIFIKALQLSGVKGQFVFQTTPLLIIGFRYEYGADDCKDKVLQVLDIMTASIMHSYYKQIDTADVNDIHLAIAA